MHLVNGRYSRAIRHDVHSVRPNENGTVSTVEVIDAWILCCSGREVFALERRSVEWSQAFATTVDFLFLSKMIDNLVSATLIRPCVHVLFAMLDFIVTPAQSCVVVPAEACHGQISWCSALSRLVATWAPGYLFGFDLHLARSSTCVNTIHVPFDADLRRQVLWIFVSRGQAGGVWKTSMFGKPRGPPTGRPQKRNLM